MFLSYIRIFCPTFGKSIRSGQRDRRNLGSLFKIRLARTARKIFQSCSNKPYLETIFFPSNERAVITTVFDGLRENQIESSQAKRCKNLCLKSFHLWDIQILLDNMEYFSTFSQKTYIF